MNPTGRNTPPTDAAKHSALMDNVYRRQRHIYDLSRKYYLLGRDRLIRELDAKPGERIVEIGCGTARNMIKIGQAYPGVHLYGLDASNEMLRTAGEAVAGQGMSERIVLRQGLAEFLNPQMFGLSAAFDRAVFSYSLSMIPDWRGALRAAAENTKSDGRIHIVDFGDLEGLWPMAAKCLKAWLKLFHVAPRRELLQTIQRHAPAGTLKLLPGRYAFLFSGTPSDLANIADKSAGTSLP